MAKPQLSVSASVAMSLTGFNPLKFNEAVSRGFYEPRSPEPEPGKPRQYGELDLVALFIMQRLMTVGANLGVAASRAEHVVFLFEQNPNAKVVWTFDNKGDELRIVKGKIPADLPPAPIIFERSAIVSYLRRKLEGKS